MDLISSNVVMVARRRYNGKVKDCQVHDIVLHFCLEKSREEKFMVAVKGRAGQFQPLDWKGSRASFSFSKELSKFASLGSKTRKPFHLPVRSLITTNEGNYFDGIPFCQISELRLLKALDLSSHRVEVLSSATFKRLIHLKYLAVCAIIFDFHPESYPCVETLIVKIVRSKSGVRLPVSFWEMEKLRHVEITEATFDKPGMFEGSSKLENLRILRNVRFPIDEAHRLDVLLQRCPNLQHLQIDFESRYPLGYDIGNTFCLTLENLTQLQILQFSFLTPHIVSGLQLPSNLNKLVLSRFHTERDIPLIEGLSSLEYLKYMDTEEWCFGGITFHKLKKLKLVKLVISRWDVSEESFPLLEKLVIKRCRKLKEIPLSFADIPTLKQIKLMWCDSKSLQASAVRIKKEVEAIEGCDRIDITIQDKYPEG